MALNQKSNGEPESDERDFIVPFPPPNVRLNLGIVVIGITAVFLVLPALGLTWLLFLCVNQILVLAGWGSAHLLLISGEDSWLPVAGAGLAILAIALPLGWLIVRIGAHWSRRVRRSWWLRLSSTGFEVNDRAFAPRRYAWRDIDKFMLVAPAADVENAVVAPVKTYSEAFVDELARPGADATNLIVGFHCRPRRRRRRPSIFVRHLRGRDGTTVDGLVMGYWDRPFDEAVDLMNEWLARHKDS